MPFRDLHALGFRLRNLSTTTDLTAGQERLWLSVVSELEYRHRAEPTWWLRCTCELCLPPFDPQSPD